MNTNHKKNILFLIAAIIVITGITYYPALKNDFVNWDDANYVMNNPDIRELSFKSIKKIFTSFHLNLYKPLVLLSFMIEYHFFQLDPYYYHLTNIIFHIFNTALVFWSVFLIVMLERSQLIDFNENRDYYLKCAIFIAAFCSVLFATHPMHTESVAWVAERKDLLYSFFLLLSYICYLKYLQNTDNYKIYILSCIFIILSLISKPMGIVYPGIIVITDFLIKRKLSKKSIFDKIPFIVICLFFFFMILLGEKHKPPENQLLAEIDFGMGVPKLIQPEHNPENPSVPIRENIKYPAYVTLFYFVKLLAPFKLAGLYPPPPEFKINISQLITPLIIIIVLVSLQHTRKIFFGWWFFIISFLTVIQIKITGAALVADRYTYLSSIGLFYIIAEFIVYIYRKNKTIFIFLFISAFVWLITTFGYYNFDFKPQQFYYYFVGTSIIYILFAFIILFFHERKKIIGAAILTVIGIFIFLCCYHIFSYRCGVWQNTLNLWNDVIKHYPTATLAYNNRGCIFMGAGDFEKAKADFTVGLKINPYDYSLLSNLGLLYYMNNKFDESIDIHLQLIQLYPQSSENYFKLAFLYYTQKKTSECLAVYKTLMTYTDKFNYKIYNNLGIIARRENKYDKAEYFFNKTHIHSFLSCTYKSLPYFL